MLLHLITALFSLHNLELFIIFPQFPLLPLSDFTHPKLDGKSISVFLVLESQFHPNFRMENMKAVVAGVEVLLISKKRQSSRKTKVYKICRSLIDGVMEVSAEEGEF